MGETPAPGRLWSQEVGLLTLPFGSERRGTLALAGLALTALFARVLFPAAAAQSGSPDNNVIDLQLASSSDQFVGVLRQWSAANPHAVGIIKEKSIVQLDFLFPLIYGLTFAFGYAWLTGRRKPTRLDRVLFALPIVAAGFDYVENVLHLYLLRGVSTLDDVNRAAESGAFDPGLVLAASSAARVKYLLLAASVVGILGAAIGRIRRARNNRGADRDLS
jgi:hypothetical protein